MGARIAAPTGFESCSSWRTSAARRQGVASSCGRKPALRRSTARSVRPLIVVFYDVVAPAWCVRGCCSGIFPLRTVVQACFPDLSEVHATVSGCRASPFFSCSIVLRLIDRRRPGVSLQGCHSRFSRAVFGLSMCRWVTWHLAGSVAPSLFRTGPRWVSSMVEASHASHNSSLFQRRPHLHCQPQQPHTRAAFPWRTSPSAAGRPLQGFCSFCRQRSASFATPRTLRGSPTWNT